MDLHSQDYFGLELDFLCFFQLGRTWNRVGLLDLPQSGLCFSGKCGLTSSTPLAPELGERDALALQDGLSAWTFVRKWHHEEALSGGSGGIGCNRNPTSII